MLSGVSARGRKEAINPIAQFELGNSIAGLLRQPDRTLRFNNSVVQHLATRQRAHRGLAQLALDRHGCFPLMVDVARLTAALVDTRVVRPFSVSRIQHVLPEAPDEIVVYIFMVLCCEGCGAVVTERASERAALALLLGTAINQDGRSANLTSPNGPSQEMQPAARHFRWFQ
eukprot:6482892-Amphidinium_carterae.1